MPDNMDVVQRIARLETRMEDQRERSKERHAELLLALGAATTQRGLIETVHDKRIDALEVQFQRYQGAWGLLTIIGTALTAAWVLFGEWIKSRL